MLKPKLVVSFQDDYNVYTAIQNTGFFLRQENSRAKTFLLSKINGLNMSLENCHKHISNLCVLVEHALWEDQYFLTAFS